MRDYPEEFDYEPICECDFDEAQYLGSGDDGVYFDAKYFKGEHPDPGGWYMTAIVDSNTSNFTTPLASDDGPYPTFVDAMYAGMNAAVEWCITNDITLDDAELDATREAINLDANFA